MATAKAKPLPILVFLLAALGFVAWVLWAPTGSPPLPPSDSKQSNHDALAHAEDLSLNARVAVQKLTGEAQRKRLALLSQKKQAEEASVMLEQALKQSQDMLRSKQQDLISLDVDAAAKETLKKSLNEKVAILEAEQNDMNIRMQVAAKIRESQDQEIRLAQSLLDEYNLKLAAQAQALKKLQDDQQKLRLQHKQPVPKVDVNAGLNSGNISSSASTRVNSSINSSKQSMKSGVLNPEEEKALEEKSKQKFAFNAHRSDQLSLHRAIPDTRHALCGAVDYSFTKMLPVSVIICFVDEVVSVLFRTIWSVLDRSPPSLLNEIILVDDGSTASWITDSGFTDAAKNISSKIRLVQTKQRLGLIRARLVGADAATSEILVFLDSHCEANVGWLEPLSSFISENRTRVACPTIDSISSETMTYGGSSGYSHGSFHWTLDFTWKGATDAYNKPALPIASPTMAGGLFAISKSYLNEIGRYDEDMGGWGGENIEMSFRIWMCGGTLHIIPCSRVGHIFRSRHPYEIPNSTINESFLRNSIRAARVWMDEYVDTYYFARPDAKKAEFGDVSSRIALRERLHCKSFKWYLDTLLPDKFIPSNRTVVVHGQVKGVFGCLDSRAAGLAYPCHRLGGHSTTQSFMYTIHKDIRTVWDQCLLVTQKKQALSMVSCSATSTKWVLLENGGIQMDGTDTCLALEQSPRGAPRLTTQQCDASREDQRLKFTGIFAS